MNDLDWLVGRRFQSLANREHDWAFLFDDQTCVVAACLWRLIENGRIRVTDKDHGHQFGLPAPVDAAARVNSVLAGAAVRRVTLVDGTLDLAIEFDSGLRLEFIPDSAGYEAWDITSPDERFIAIGGGRLDVFRDSAPGDGPPGSLPTGPRP